MLVTRSCTFVRPLCRTANASSHRRGLFISGTNSQSSQPQQDTQKSTSKEATATEKAHEAPKKTQAQLDEELMQKLANMSGEGGEAGIEYEDGKPAAMKRGVKSQMFRIMPVRNQQK